jgi:hypothetical protein
VTKQLTLETLDNLLGQITHEPAKRSLEDERQRAASISADYAARLLDRATFRRLLADDALDATRFRWWFTQPHNRDAYDLDGWRQRIDAQMSKENGK